MNIKDQIRAEIERLYDGEAPKHDQQCDFDDGYFTGIGAISKFLDTLPEQPVSTIMTNEMLMGKIQPEQPLIVLKESNALFDECVEKCDPAIMKEVSDNIDKMLGKQPVEGLDVTNFCKPVEPGIAKCVADHWWELLDDENAADKKAVKEIVKTVHKEVPRQGKEMVKEQPVEELEKKITVWASKDKDGTIFFSNGNKPIRMSDGAWDSWDDLWFTTEENLLPDLSWNDEPIKVELIVKPI